LGYGPLSGETTVQQAVQEQSRKKAYVEPHIRKQEQLKAVVEGVVGILTSGTGPVVTP
jgi:hypothetical protein